MLCSMKIITTCACIIALFVIMFFFYFQLYIYITESVFIISQEKNSLSSIHHMSVEGINNSKKNAVETTAFLPDPSSTVVDNGLNVNGDVTENLPTTEKTVLKRHLGLFSGVSFIMGVIIGE